MPVAYYILHFYCAFCKMHHGHWILNIEYCILHTHISHRVWLWWDQNNVQRHKKLQLQKLPFLNVKFFLSHLYLDNLVSTKFHVYDLLQFSLYLILVEFANWVFKVPSIQISWYGKAQKCCSETTYDYMY